MDSTKVQQEPDEVAIRDLKRGTWVQLIDEAGDDYGQVEVRHVEAHHGCAVVMFVTSSHAAPQTLYFDDETTTVPLIPAERLAEMKAAAERAERIADIRAYADWLETNPSVQIDPPDAQVNLSGPDAVDQVRAFAATFGVPVREDLADRTSALFKVGSVEHRVIAWHNVGRPADPQPATEEPGLNYGRGDEGADPQPSAGRVAPRYEGVGEPGPDPDTACAAHDDAHLGSPCPDRTQPGH